MSVIKKLLPEIWRNKSQIVEGIKNRIFKKEHIEELAKYRQDICESCIWNSAKYLNDEQIPEVIQKVKGNNVRKSITSRPDKHCINCGCNIATKTRCLSCQCPIAKWMPVVTDDQKHEIEQIINNESESNK